MNESFGFKDFQKMISTESDGSLPEIAIEFDGLSQVKAAVSFILSSSSSFSRNVNVSNGGVSKVDTHELLKEVDDMICNQKHVLVEGLFGIQEIGLFATGLNVCLDIRTGKDWSSNATENLLLFLKNLCSKFGANDIWFDRQNEFLSSESSNDVSLFLKKCLIRDF